MRHLQTLCLVLSRLRQMFHILAVFLWVLLPNPANSEMLELTSSILSATTKMQCCIRSSLLRLCELQSRLPAWEASLPCPQIRLCRAVTRELIGDGYRRAAPVTENLGPTGRLSVYFYSSVFLQKVLSPGVWGSALR